MKKVLFVACGGIALSLHVYGHVCSSGDGEADNILACRG